MKTYSEIRAQARESMQGRWGSAAIALVVYCVLMALCQGPYQAHTMWGGQIESMLVRTWTGSAAFLVFLLAYFFVECPLSMGLSTAFVKANRRESDSILRDMFSIGYANMGRAIAYLILLSLIFVGVFLAWYIVAIVLLVVYVAVFMSGVPFKTLAQDMDITSDDALQSLIDIFAAQGALFIVIGIVVVAALFVWVMYISYKYSMTYFLMYDNPEWSTIDCMRESKRMMNGHKWELFVLDLTFIGWLVLCIFVIPALWVAPYINMAHAVFYQELLQPDDTNSAAVLV